eukprot:scaffold42610_cov66-Phaeocystis_antarctica.AAC.4
MFSSRDDVPTCALKPPVTSCQPPRRPAAAAGTISSLQIESSLREMLKRTSALSPGASTAVLL